MTIKKFMMKMSELQNLERDKKCDHFRRKQKNEKKSNG